MGEKVAKEREGGGGEFLLETIKKLCSKSRKQLPVVASERALLDPKMFRFRLVVKNYSMSWFYPQRKPGGKKGRGRRIATLAGFK